jgi:diguanylate cyclase (GGDEF)-like protein
VTPTSRVPLPLPGLTVPVPAGLLRALLTLATRDERTTALTFPAWRANACARLAAAADQDLPTMLAALLVLDVDAFHDLNTAWGHPAGDQVLARIAEVLHDNAGTAALVGRYGGDEFVAFVPGADLPQACEVAERIRAAVAGLQILIHGPHGGNDVRPEPDRPFPVGQGRPPSAAPEGPDRG